MLGIPEAVLLAVQVGWDRVMGTREDAANELALRLENVADGLAKSGVRAKRIAYGPPRVAGFGRRRSPKGFLLHSSGPRLMMLLPDGRLWQYHERRNIEGIYYDARTDHARAMHSSLPVQGGRFNFLGAVLGKHHFGYREADVPGDQGGSPRVYELGAIVGRGGTSAQFIDADQALAAITGGL